MSKKERIKDDGVAIKQYKTWMCTSSTAISQQVVVKELTKNCQRSMVRGFHSKGSNVTYSSGSQLGYLHRVGNCDRKMNKYQNIEKYLVIRVEHPLGEWVPFPVQSWKLRLGSGPYYNATAEGFLPWNCSSHPQQLFTKGLPTLNGAGWRVVAPHPLNTFPEKKIEYGISGKYFPFITGIVTAYLHQWSYVARNISFSFKRKPLWLTLMLFTKASIL